MKIRVGDAHCHLNPVRGMGTGAFADRFIQSGGWFLALVNLPSWSYGVKAVEAGDYMRIYNLTISTARELRERGLRVSVILGVHPAEVARLVELGASLADAARLAIEAYRMAAGLVERGLADGLGEAGRPHWRAERSLVEACNSILDYVMELAEKLGCVVHVHAERGGSETIRDVASRAPRGLRVVLHHAEGERAQEAYACGLYPSVPARPGEVLGALSSGFFTVESDFLDDPARPGAVIAPWSISRTFKRLILKGLLNPDRAEEILVRNVERLYGLSPP